MSVDFSKFKAIKTKVKEEKVTHKTAVIHVRSVCSPFETIKGLFFPSGEPAVKVYLGLIFFLESPCGDSCSIHSTSCQNDKSAVARVSKQTIKKNTIISSSLLH